MKLEQLFEAHLRPDMLPSREDLITHLQQKFGKIKIKKGKRSITVIMKQSSIPEIVDDTANRILRTFGLEYTDLVPGRPGQHGQTNKFTIYGPELKPAPVQPRGLQ